MTSTKTEIATLFEKLVDLERLESAAGVEAEAANRRYLALAPQVPEALRFASVNAALVTEPIAPRFVRKGWHGSEFPWVAADGWADALAKCWSDAGRERIKVKLDIADRFEADTAQAKVASGYAEAQARYDDATSAVFDCQRQILTACPVTNDDLRIQAQILASDLKHFEPDPATLASFVGSVARLAA